MSSIQAGQSGQIPTVQTCVHAYDSPSNRNPKGTGYVFGMDDLFKNLA